MFRRVLAAPMLGAAPAAGQPPAPPVQPGNIGELKTEATRCYDSGAYLTDLQAAAAPAAAWIAEQAHRVARPAVVFDVDRTALSNREVIRANDSGRIVDGPCAALPQGPCGWHEWDLRTQSTVIPPTLDVFRTARDKGAAVLFVTGPDESQRAATSANLDAAGYTPLIMEPVAAHYVSAADFKAPQRARIEQQGYTVIANIVDQPSDLAGGFAQRTFLRYAHTDHMLRRDGHG
jgi:acid phosphatase